MKKFCEVNNIGSVAKHRLVKAGVIGNQFSVDENFLRLKHHLHPLAMYVHETLFYQDADDGYDPKRRFFINDDEVMLTNEALRIVRAIEPDEAAMFIVKQLGAVPASSIPAKVSTLFSGLTDLVYDTSGSTELLNHTFTHAVVDDVPQSARQLLAQYDMSKALSVEHPEGMSGANNAARLLKAQSTAIRNYHKSQLNYNLLDFRKVLSHPNFNKLQHLNTHPDNQYLKEFLSGAKDLDAAYNACVS